jgi:hypothetical protein
VDCIYGASDILIKDVFLTNNCRQGISVEDNVNVTIENCIMINTGGLPPSAGIDFEPFSPEHKMNNIKMINCFMEKNTGRGIVLAFGALNNASAPISLNIKHCYITDGTIIWGVPETGVNGAISFEDCIIGNGNIGFDCSKSANRLPITFTNCKWQNFKGAVKFNGGGGVQFNDCTINEPDSQAVIVREGTVANITGNLTVNGPYGAQSDFGSGNNVTAKITENKTKPPVVSSVTPSKFTLFSWGNTIDISAEAYDPDIGIVNGSGITKVDFALWRGDAPVATISDVSAPFEGKFDKTAGYEQGIYLARITAYSQDGTNTVDVAPISLLGTPNPSGLTFTSSGKVTVPTNGFLGYKVTVKNNTGSAASFTTLKNQYG